MGWALLLLIAVAVLWAIFTYNGLVSLRNKVQNGWKQIDVQLKRRHDLIPSLVNTVRGAMEFERGTLERVIAARNRAAQAQGVRETSAAEGELSQALRQLFALVESYPTLRSNDNILKLQEEITTTENQISFARQFYNDMVMRFNTQQEVFPASLIANQFGFRRAEFFSAEEADRAVPEVDLSMRA
jgi:LemA protein